MLSKQTVPEGDLRQTETKQRERVQRACMHDRFSHGLLPGPGMDGSSEAVWKSASRGDVTCLHNQLIMGHAVTDLPAKSSTDIELFYR